MRRLRASGVGLEALRLCSNPSSCPYPSANSDPNPDPNLFLSLALALTLSLTLPQALRLCSSEDLVELLECTPAEAETALVLFKLAPAAVRAALTPTLPSALPLTLPLTRSLT